MGEYSFPAAPGEGGGEVRFVWSLIVTKADLGWEVRIMQGQTTSSLTSR